MKNIKNEILSMSRQDQGEQLSPWFDNMLSERIGDEFADHEGLNAIKDGIIADLTNYREEGGVSTVVLGMSGGVDSALTAALFKAAGWKVIGVTMPINQNPDETDRGIEACAAIGIEHLHIDLSDMFVSMQNELGLLDEEIDNNNDSMVNKATLIRRGNIRARLRMITLYNLAALHGGLVASTDNLSELAAGFWTINGDCGDVAPIQSLTKSWEVPMLAKMIDVPEKTWKAKPTDGLGIANGDEDQFGFTYLELDLMLFSVEAMMSDGLFDDVTNWSLGYMQDSMIEYMGIKNDPRAMEVYEKLLGRMGSTWFKRADTINLSHPIDGNNRFRQMNNIDRDLFYPSMMKKG